MANDTRKENFIQWLVENNGENDLEEIADTIKEYIEAQIEYNEDYYQSEDFMDNLFNDINWIIENNLKAIEDHYGIKLTYDDYYNLSEQIEISIGGIFGPPNNQFYFHSESLGEIETQIEKDEDIALITVWDYVLTKVLNREFCIHNRTGSTCFEVYDSTDNTYYFTLPEKLEL